MNLSKRIILLTLMLISSSLLWAQEGSTRSTQDLDFLLGEWEVTRIYSPDTDKERSMKGRLVCKESLDGKFINCRYEMERPGKIRGVDEVYFNYNQIYELYESMWLSSTWPIKVLMQGTLNQGDENIILETEAEFLIENDVMEYVKGKLIIGAEGDARNSFKRKTHIRTSKDEAGYWFHHMTETAERIEG